MNMMIHWRITSKPAATRGGGFGDFNDIIVDQHGRVWFGLAHNVAGEIGIFGTLPRGRT